MRRQIDFAHSKKAGSQKQKIRKYTKIKRYKHKYREKIDTNLTNST